MLFYITWTKRVEQELTEVVSALEELFPDAIYYGNEASGSIVNGQFGAGMYLTCMILEDEDSRCELVWVEKDTTISTLEELWNDCKAKNGLKAVELIPSMSYINEMHIDRNIPDLPEDVLVFGGASVNYGNATYDANVIAKGHPLTKDGMAVVLYYGKNLHFASAGVLGWKGLGRWMKVTASDGNTIYEIDHQPAYSIYEKYLNLTEKDRDDLVFPLIAEENGNQYIRTPQKVLADKSMKMFAGVPAGTKVRISYGDKNTILEGIHVKAKEIAKFVPQAMKAYSCAARRLFWGDAEIGRETEILQELAPTCGFYTGGEIFRFEEQLRVLNQTLVIVALREGDLDSFSPKALPEDMAVDKSLVSRLAYFAKTVSAEEEEAHHKLKRDMQIIDVVADEFVCVIHIDTSNDVETIYRWDESVFGEAKKYPEVRNFTHRLELIRDSFVYDVDRESFFDATRKDHIREQLQTKSNYSHNFRIHGRNGDIENWQIRFSYADSNQTCFVCGFRNIDAELKAEIDRRREMERQIHSTTADLKEKIVALNRMSEGTVELLGEVVERRNAESGEHIRRVKYYTYVLADMVRMALPEYGLTKEDVDMIVMASSLHDIGKISIPDSILLKPGRLTDEEFAVIKTHSEKGAAIIKGLVGIWNEKYIQTAYDICLCHHERWNGKGYPKGLVGDEIPISAQIVAVADCYDALTSERVYKHAYTPEVAFDMIIRGECGKLSDKILSCLKICREQFEKLARKGSGAIAIPEVRTEIYAGSGTSAGSIADKIHTSQEKHLAVIAGIARDYDYVCHINSLLNIITPYYISDRFAREYGGYLDGMEISPEDMDRFLNRFVLPEDIRSFRVATDRDNSTAYLKRKNFLIHRFRGIVGGETRYFDIKLILDESDAGHVVLGIVDVDRLVREKRRHIETHSKYARLELATKPEEYISFVNHFLGSYLAAFYVNLADGSMVVYKQSETLINLCGEQQDFQAFFSRYITSCVHPTDREMMDRATSIEFIRKYLAKHPSYSLLFKETASGKEHWVRFSVFGGRDENHAAVSLTEAEDDGNSRKSLETLENLVYQDVLTGVGNAAAYHEMDKAVDKVIHAGVVPNVAIIFCDLNDLKKTNDIYGHAVGDEYIQKCCHIIRSIFKNSRVYRIGGDEFIVVPEGPDFENKDELFRKLSECKLIASGMAVFDPSTDSTLEDTRKRADLAMYVAKKQAKHIQQKSNDGE